VLTGKAREVYSALSVEQSSHYDAVKSAILKAYELVPEAIGSTSGIVRRKRSKLLQSLLGRRRFSLIVGVHPRRLG